MIFINFVCLLIFHEGLYIQNGDRGNFLNIDNSSYVFYSSMVSISVILALLIDDIQKTMPKLKFQ